MLITLFDCVPNFLLGLIVTTRAPVRAPAPVPSPNTLTVHAPAPVPTPPTLLVAAPTPAVAMLVDVDDVVDGDVAPTPAPGFRGFFSFGNMFPSVPTFPPSALKGSRAKNLKKAPPETSDFPPESIDLPPTPRRRHPGSRVALTELEQTRKAEFMPIASGARDAMQDSAERKRAAKRQSQLNWLRMGGDAEMADDDTFDALDKVLEDYKSVATDYATLQSQLGYDRLDGTALPVTTAIPPPTAHRPPALPDEDDIDEIEGRSSGMSLSDDSSLN
jgi:hypothetical protein